MTSNPIIIALDLESAEEARKLVRNVGDSCRFYKVGLELYAAAGRTFVEELLLPELRRGDVLILDNLAAHGDAEVQRRLAAAGVELAPLPVSVDVWRVGLAVEVLRSGDPWLTVKSTLFCSAAVSPSHHAPNSSENSTSHATALIMP